MTTAGTGRLRIRCTGAVQGVGFRPFVHRLATSLGLGGAVGNDPDGVWIEVEGPEEALHRFVATLRSGAPPLARLDAVEVARAEPRGETGFRVAPSGTGPRLRAMVPPDAALCADCRREMEDPADRRHRYPFTGCASCGPRFSLVRSLPWDRARTTMACFPLCPECEAEYHDPANRRFHTEPLCCPACGPRLWFVRPDGSGGRLEDGAAMEAASALLAEGGILALKGLGGYQLACRADREAAVRRLRERKRRPTRPFALMVPDLASVEALVTIGDAERELLLGPRSPIVLAPRRPGAPVAAAVAPGIGDLGVMLPTTPLHVELFRRGAPPVLVMTSGNVSDEPIVTGNREALERLGEIADAFLAHDRDIARRVDDSVVRTAPGGPLLVRRSRGWVPEPVALPAPSPEPVLALGAHLQVAACLAVGDHAYPSQHVGDLETEPARRFLHETATGLEAFLEATAGVVAVDLHPDLGSTRLGERLAGEREARLVRVQHHLAHLAAVLAEHGLPLDGTAAVGLILDGTGMGTDHTAWGGEFLKLGPGLAWERAAHLGTFPLVGGERAVREPWRVAAAVLERAGEGGLIEETPLAGIVDGARLAGVRRLAREGRWPMATGAGRLFEAAGALLGLAAVNGWEGEAAARLEFLAAGAGGAAPWPEVDPDDPEGFPAAVLTATARRAASGEPPERIAAGFHETFAALAARTALAVRGNADAPVVLAGGCFVNRLLLGGVTARLEGAGATVLRPRSLPPGDGAVALGQAVWTAALLAAGG